MSKNSRFLREIKKLDKQGKKSSAVDSRLSCLKENQEGFKMSNILENFMSPYLHLAQDLDSCQKLFTLGVIAWNVSFYPESERDDLTDLFFSQEIIGDNPIIGQELKEIILELVDRKLSLFVQYDRLIVDFEIQKIGKSYKLSVTSNEANERKILLDEN